jgi:hypothetical protein
MACTPTAATSAPSATLPILPSDSAEGAGAGAGVATAATKFADRFGTEAACRRSRPTCASCATRTPPAVSRHSISAVSENATTDRASSGRDAKKARRSFFLLSESSSSPAAFFGTPGAGTPESPEDPRAVPGTS